MADQLAARPVGGAAAGDRGADVGDEQPGVVRVVLGRIEITGRRDGEPVVQETRPHPGQPRLRADEDLRGVVLDHHLVQVGDHHGGGVLQALHELAQCGLQVRGPGRVRCGPPRQVEQVVGLVGAEAQGAGERVQDRLGRDLPATLLQLGVVVGGQAGQPRHLVAAQARHPPPGAGRQTDRLRGQPVSA